MSDASRLAVLIDGTALSDDEARALWTEFSAHMDANRGDMAGFAKAKGWVSVAPEYRQGRAVLIVSTTAAPPKPVAISHKPKPKPIAHKPSTHKPMTSSHKHPKRKPKANQKPKAGANKKPKPH